ncbi:MAG: DUF1700 domain-containing protein [Bacilli bacterium]|nr:DUF1700 domain-containing protein [Bacilli bacterium]
MTKQEFLTELRKNLNGLPKDEIEDRINFYEEMINDRMDEGKTEEQAVADIGTTDEAVRTIASQTKMSTLVKEKMKLKRSLTGWEILLIALAFPVWFPLLMTVLSLLFTAYIMTWVLVIVSFSVEAGLIAGAGGGIAAFVCSLIEGAPSLIAGGGALLCIGGACLFVLACIGATKVTLKISKSIFLGIKSKIIRGRN